MNVLHVRSVIADQEYLTVELHLDLDIPCDGSQYATDLPELVRSTDRAGEFFIITCTCGEAGCAGIEEGVMVDHVEGTVRWHLRYPHPVRHYIFDAEQYRGAVSQGTTDAKKLLRSARIGELQYVPHQNERVLPYSD